MNPIEPPAGIPGAAGKKVVQPEKAAVPGAAGKREFQPFRAIRFHREIPGGNKTITVDPTRDFKS